MKVKDILEICCPVWIPAKNHEQLEPIVSVLLPTFRRAESGLFERAVNSVLNQDLKNIELIIIDDCSIDGTFDLIKYYMQADSRVSCIRHTHNIGLPAISEYEGYMKSKGKYIAFIFDDNEWQKDYLSKTIPFMIKNDLKASYGIARLYYTESEYISIGESHVLDQYNDLLTTNRIANGAIVLDREVVENIGFYDPHITLVRLCDWDLNRRIADNYLFEATNIYATDEYGAMLSDSLGNSLKMSSWSAEERIQSRREDCLKLENFGECDVFEFISKNTDLYIEDIINFSKKFLTKKWFFNKTLNYGNLENEIVYKKIFIVTKTFDATVTLAIERFIHEHNSNIIFKFQQIYNLVESNLATADGIIFIRNIDYYEKLINKCERLGIDMYYYLDDNFFLLDKDDLELKSLVSFLNRDYLKKFKSIFVSSNELKRYLDKKYIHDNLILTEPIIGNLIFNNNRKQDNINIAFMGGTFREKIFLDIVMPALAKIANIYKINLFFPNGENNKLIKSYLDKNFSITFIEKTLSLNKAIQRFGKNDIDILIHCGPNIENNMYKTENALINATQLGAVLVASNNYPYSKHMNSENKKLVCCDNEIDSWYTSIFKLIEDVEFRTNIYSNANKYCFDKYNGSNSLDIFHKNFLNNNKLSYSDIIMRYELLYIDLLTSPQLNQNPIYNKENTRIEETLVFSKYINDIRKYVVRTTKENINKIGMIFSSDFFGCSGKITLNVYQKGKLLGSSVKDISQILYGHLTFFEYEKLSLNTNKSIVLEIVVSYNNKKLPMGVYERREKRSFVYKLLNKMNLKPKGKDVLFVEFE